MTETGASMRTSFGVPSSIVKWRAIWIQWRTRMLGLTVDGCSCNVCLSGTANTQRNSVCAPWSRRWSKMGGSRGARVISWWRIRVVRFARALNFWRSISFTQRSLMAPGGWEKEKESAKGVPGVIWADSTSTCSSWPLGLRVWVWVMQRGTLSCGNRTSTTGRWDLICVVKGAHAGFICTWHNNLYRTWPNPHSTDSDSALDNSISNGKAWAPRFSDTGERLMGITESTMTCLSQCCEAVKM